MNIVVAGGGRVGFHLARLLSGEHQNVTVIESDTDRLEQIDYALDVSTVRGDGASVMLMQTINVGSADLFVASMGNDEKNLIAAATAKGLGVKQVVARVDNPMYIDSNILYETILAVDYIMSPDALAAREIAGYIEHPGILATESFGRGLVQMRKIQVEISPTVDGKTLKDVILPGRNVLVGVIERDGKPIIPRGDAVIKPGDVITLIGHKDKIAAVQKLFIPEETVSLSVAIMGGSTIGLRVAQSLENKMKSIKIFERREDRSNELAALLRKTKVVRRDATSRVGLEQEHIDKVDVFVAATNDDERNIMACVLAKEVGAKKVLCIVQQPDFAPLLERLDIDLAVTPRACIANGILKLAHKGQLTSISVIAEGQAEILEFPVSPTSPLLDRPLREASARVPRGALIATILRGEKVIVPSGEDMITAGDSVIVIASRDVIDAVRKLLAKKA